LAARFAAPRKQSILIWIKAPSFPRASGFDAESYLWRNDAFQFSTPIIGQRWLLTLKERAGRLPASMLRMPLRKTTS